MRNISPRYNPLFERWKNLGILNRYDLVRDLLDGRAEYRVEFVDGSVLTLDDESLDGYGYFTLKEGMIERNADSIANTRIAAKIEAGTEQVDAEPKKGRTIRIRNSAEREIHV